MAWNAEILAFFIFSSLAFMHKITIKAWIFGNQQLVQAFYIDSMLKKFSWTCFLVHFWFILRNEPQLLVFVSWRLIVPPGTKLFNICTWILLLNTPEMNYLHCLTKVNDQNSHLGWVYGVHVDWNKKLGMENFEVPLDLTFLAHVLFTKLRKEF